MKVLKKYEILNSEGPVMILNKHTDHWSVSFNGSRIHTVIEPYEMLTFLTANGTITSEDKTYRFGDYPQDMKMSFSNFNALVEILWEDHKSLCKNNEEYSKKYCKDEFN